jgi:hypothetical protein
VARLVGVDAVPRSHPVGAGDAAIAFRAGRQDGEFRLTLGTRPFGLGDSLRLSGLSPGTRLAKKWVPAIDLGGGR